jgi:lysozyme
MLERSRRTISSRGLAFIKGFESFVGHVYDDLLPPVKGKYREWKGGPVKGTLTIGYGHTNAARHPLKIEQGLRISEAQAREILDVDLDDVEGAVNRLVKVPLTQGQYDALVSLTFNMGEGNLRKSSLLAKLNRGDYDGARQAFDLYVKSRGKTLRGLQRRRDGEQALWDARYGDARPPAGPVDHPAEVDGDPGVVRTLAKSKIAQAAAGIGVAAGGEAIATGADTLDQVARVKYSADDIGLTDHLVALAQSPRVWIALGVIVAVGFVIYWRWRDHR